MPSAAVKEPPWIAGNGPAAAVPDRPKVRMPHLAKLRSTNVVVDGGPAALLASLGTQGYSNSGGYEPTEWTPSRPRSSTVSMSA